MATKEVAQELILSVLKDTESISTYDLHIQKEIGHDVIVGACKSLAFSGMIIAQQSALTLYNVTPEGHDIISSDASPEMMVVRYLDSLPDKAIGMEEGKGLFNPGIFAAGLRCAQAAKWTKMDGGRLVLVTCPDKDEVYDYLKMIDANTSLSEMAAKMGVNEAVVVKKLNDLKKRKVIEIKKITTFILSKGENYGAEVKTYVTDFKKQMILNNEADTAEFRPINLQAAGATMKHGSSHSLMQVRRRFAKILISMGFEEMKTDQWVESSFWNFDSLFQPQQHPARDSHDTFFLKNPKMSNETSFPTDYFDRVADVHENGGYGSLGWRYPYSKNETCKNVMRTHTTACSSRHLYALAQDFEKTKVFTPKKYFSIDRVFRNETVDSTHLAEFHQVEGLIADRNMTLSDLMGFMKTFYAKIGISNLRFKPAYNPYTEPSMEIFGYHEKKKCYIEVGNSGIFRPEMLRPMNLPEDVSVIAWGLGLDRMTMIRYNISNIRDLFGYKSVIGL